VSAKQCAIRWHKTSPLRCGRDIAARQYHFNNLYSFRWSPRVPHQRRNRINHIILQVIFRQCASATVFCRSPCADAKAMPLARGAPADPADSEARRSQPTARLVADTARLIAENASSRPDNIFPPRCVGGGMDIPVIRDVHRPARGRSVTMLITT
jgi:hypothetical protein